jgi:hypothetical protein
VQEINDPVRVTSIYFFSIFSGSKSRSREVIYHRGLCTVIHMFFSVALISIMYEHFKVVLFIWIRWRLVTDSRCFLFSKYD